MRNAVAFAWNRSKMNKQDIESEALVVANAICVFVMQSVCAAPAEQQAQLAIRSCAIALGDLICTVAAERPELLSLVLQEFAQGVSDGVEKAGGR